MKKPISIKSLRDIFKAPTQSRGSLTQASEQTVAALIELRANLADLTARRRDALLNGTDAQVIDLDQAIGVANREIDRAVLTLDEFKAALAETAKIEEQAAIKTQAALVLELSRELRGACLAVDDRATSLASALDQADALRNRIREANMFLHRAGRGDLRAQDLFVLLGTMTKEHPENLRRRFDGFVLPGYRPDHVNLVLPQPPGRFMKDLALDDQNIRLAQQNDSFSALFEKTSETVGAMKRFKVVARSAKFRVGELVELDRSEIELRERHVEGVMRTGENCGVVRVKSEIQLKAGGECGMLALPRYLEGVLVSVE